MMLRLICSLICILNFIYSTAYAQNGKGLSVPEQIAIQNKNLVLLDDDKLINELNKIETGLLDMRASIERAESWDFSNVTDVGIRLSLAASTILIGLTTVTGRGESAAWTRLWFTLYSTGTLALANALTLVDLLLSPDLDPAEFDIKLAETLASLQEYRSQLQGEQRDNITQLIQLVKTLNTTMTEEQRSEAKKNSSQLISLSLGAMGVASYILMTKDFLRSSIAVPTMFASGVASGLFSAKATFHGEDKAKILAAIDEALASVTEAKEQLN